MLVKGDPGVLLLLPFFNFGLNQDAEILTDLSS